jgi:MFS family permease
LSDVDSPDSRRTGIKLVFLLQAVTTGNLFARIPDIQAGLGIDEATLGATLIGQPVGAILMFLVASRIIEWGGTRRVLLAGIPLLVTINVLFAVAPSALTLFLVIAAFAATFAITNVAMNVEADRVEALTGKRLMNTCHGLWSLGQFGAVSFGTLMRGLEVPPLVHFGLLVPIVLVGWAFVILPMREAPVRPHAGTARKTPFALPTVATLLLVGFALAGALLEAGARNWSVIYMRDSFAAPDWVDTLPLPFFVAATALGRFFADGWTSRFGPALAARLLACLSFAGVLLLVFSPSLELSLVAFAMVGIGVCVSFPLTTSAAAQLGDRPSSENVAAVTMSTQIVMLGAPALMGFIAETLGIRMTFGVILPFVLLSVLLAGNLARRR